MTHAINYSFSFEAPQRNSNKPRNRNRRPGWRADRLRNVAEAAGLSSNEVTQVKQLKKFRRRQQSNQRQQQQLPFTQQQQKYRQQQQRQQQQQVYQQQQQQQYEQQQQHYQQQQQQQEQQYYEQHPQQQNRNRPYAKVQEGQMNPLFQREQKKAIAEGTLLEPHQGNLERSHVYED